MRIIDHQADYQAAALYALEMKEEYLRALAEVGRILAKAKAAGVSLDCGDMGFMLTKGEATAAFLGDIEGKQADH